MNNKRTWIDKLSDFISGKGFYLVVLVCVAAIALSGWYLVQGVRGGLGDTLDQPASGSAAIADKPSAQPTPRAAADPAAAPRAGSPRGGPPPAGAPPGPRRSPPIPPPQRPPGWRPPRPPPPPSSPPPRPLPPRLLWSLHGR